MTKRNNPRKANQPRPNTLPPVHDWRTTDEEEIGRRRVRAQSEAFAITNLEPQHPVFSQFRVQSPTGRTYSVEIRDVRERQFACDCVDFRTNGLGTCKHVEAVLLQLEARQRRLFATAVADGSDRFDVVFDHAGGTLRLEAHRNRRLPWLDSYFDKEGFLKDSAPEEAVESLRARRAPRLRISQEVEPWLETRGRAAQCQALRREYE
jgi:hypothetical protein